MESKKKIFWNEFINRFELYIGAVLFLAMMVLLTGQVVTRYLARAITWTEDHQKAPAYRCLCKRTAF